MLAKYLVRRLLASVVVVLGVGAMTALSAALIGVQYPHKESQFLTEGSRR